MTINHALASERGIGTAAAVIAAALLLGAVSLDANRAHAEDLIVKYDQSMLLRLPRPVAEIVIGNPTIADVTVQAANLLVITGKSFGITNIIVLDAERNVIQDQRVMVQRDEAGVVNLQKAGKRESYNCSPQCNPMVTVGDDTNFFGTIAKDAQQKAKLGESAADGGGPSGGQ